MTTDQGTGPSATTNEAADRLRTALNEYDVPEGIIHDLDAALSEERRLTVERVREALMHTDGFRPDGKRRVNAYNDDIERILDEMTAR